jgi:hypothetical protein
MPLYCLDTTAPDGAWTSEAAASSTPVVGASVAESSTEVSEGFDLGVFGFFFVFVCLGGHIGRCGSWSRLGNHAAMESGFANLDSAARHGGGSESVSFVWFMEFLCH